MESILARVMATVLGLIALGGVIYAMSSANDSSKVNAISSDISQIVSATREQFAQSQTGYANFTTANASTLYSAKVIPTDLWKGTGAVDQWGNNMTFAPAGNNAQFQITFGGANISPDVCAKIATALGGYVSMSVGGQAFTTPPDSVTANTACAGGTAFTLTYN